MLPVLQAGVSSCKGKNGGSDNGGYPSTWGVEVYLANGGLHVEGGVEIVCFEARKGCVEIDLLASFPRVDEVRPARHCAIQLPLLIPDFGCVLRCIHRGQLPEIVEVSFQQIHYRRTAFEVDSDFLYLHKLNKHGLWPAESMAME